MDKFNRILLASGLAATASLVANSPAFAGTTGKIDLSGTVVETLNDYFRKKMVLRKINRIQQGWQQVMIILANVTLIEQKVKNRQALLYKRLVLARQAL